MHDTQILFLRLYMTWHSTVTLFLTGNAGHHTVFLGKYLKLDLNLAAESVFKKIVVKNSILSFRVRIFSEFFKFWYVTEVNILGVSTQIFLQRFGGIFGDPQNINFTCNTEFYYCGFRKMENCEFHKIVNC